MSENEEIEPLIQSLPMPKGPQLDLLRLDKLNALAPGNKWFKLQPNLVKAEQAGAGVLVSFGGAFSNHLHALAALGHSQGIKTAAWIRATEGKTATPTMEDLREWGMELHFLSRSDYRRRREPAFVKNLLSGLDRPFLIPEGGANVLGARGCAGIVDHIPGRGADYDLIMLACGTGSTLAGVASAVADGVKVLGIPALKAEHFLDKDIAAMLDALGGDRGNWSLDHRYYGKGFGQMSSALAFFMRSFEAEQGVALDPVYTGKLFLAATDMHQRGELDEYRRILVVHSGGLQGRRGYPELFT